MQCHIKSVGANGNEVISTPILTRPVPDSYMEFPETKLQSKFQPSLFAEEELDKRYEKLKQLILEESHKKLCEGLVAMTTYKEIKD